MYIIIGFLILLIFLFVIYHQKGESIGHDVVGICLDTNEFKESDYKPVINNTLSVLSSKLSLPTFLTDKFGGGGYDYVTHNILVNKKKRLETIYGKKIRNTCDLVKAIKKRDYDQTCFKEATKLWKEGNLCIFDVEVELLNALVLKDKDDILFMPFYNEALTREEIMEVTDEVYTDVLEIDPTMDEGFAKIKTIRKVKKKMNYIDHKLIESTLMDYIDL